MRRILAGIMLVDGLLSAAGLAAQDPPRPAASPSAPGAVASPLRKPRGRRILGVFDAESGGPLADAEIVDLFTDDSYRTEAAGLVGLWVFASRNDSVAVRVRKIGYADTAFVVMVATGDTVPVPVFLRKAVELSPVVTEAASTKHLSPNMADFESRRTDKSLSGRFMTTAELRSKFVGLPLSDVIQAMTMGKSRCGAKPRTFVNGHPASPVGLSADDYDAVEFYTGPNVPLRFGGTSGAAGGCVLLLWTREKV